MTVVYGVDCEPCSSNDVQSTCGRSPGSHPDLSPTLMAAITPVTISRIQHWPPWTPTLKVTDLRRHLGAPHSTTVQHRVKSESMYSDLTRNPF